MTFNLYLQFRKWLCSRRLVWAHRFEYRWSADHTFMEMRCRYCHIHQGDTGGEP